MGSIRIDTADGIAIVTLDRPPVNALDHATFAEIAETFERFGRDRSTNVAILTANGDKAFCGGVDLKDSPKRYRPDGRREDGDEKGDPRDQLDPGFIVRRCFGSVHDCAVPVVAAVNGLTIGAGVALVASCDLVVASTDARFALTEINAGVLGGFRHAQRLVGAWKARRMFLTGEPVGADEVYRLGGVESVVAPEDLMTTALELARTIAGKSPIAIRLAKESANRVEALSLHDGYRLEQDYTIRVRRYADSEEARRAVLDKREVNFGWE